MTKKKRASANANTRLILDSHRIPFATPETADKMVPIESTTMIMSAAVFPAVDHPLVDAQDMLSAFPTAREDRGEDERRALLAEHGRMARPYQEVRANTIPSFALGDYEWLLAFEAPELHRIVDLMRDLRATDARRHVREETPFYTGPRVSVERLVNALP